jgi:hypothetical protein
MPTREDDLPVKMIFVASPSSVEDGLFFRHPASYGPAAGEGKKSLSG